MNPLTGALPQPALGPAVHPGRGLPTRAATSCGSPAATRELTAQRREGRSRRGATRARPGSPSPSTWPSPGRPGRRGRRTTGRRPPPAWPPLGRRGRSLRLDLQRPARQDAARPRDRLNTRYHRRSSPSKNPTPADQPRPCPPRLSRRNSSTVPPADCSQRRRPATATSSSTASRGTARRISRTSSRVLGGVVGGRRRRTRSAVRRLAGGSRPGAARRRPARHGHARGLPWRAWCRCRGRARPPPRGP